MFNFFKKTEVNIKLALEKKWHTIAIPDVFRDLDSVSDGLSSAEAFNRLEKFGLNELPQGKTDPAWKLFLRQFNSPLMYLMILAVIVSFVIDNMSDAIFIVVVMSSNALVGFYQEHKANKSLQSLQNMIKLKCRVVRGGMEQEVPVSTLVPGDVVILRAGDRVPADGRVIESDNARVNEASLTGESKSVDKNTKEVTPDASLGDISNMVFMGTIVEEGSLRVVVVETGVKTQYGDIVLMLEDTPEEPTPLQKTVVYLSKVVGLFIALVVGLIMLEGYLFGRPFDEIFAVALALFVSAIPEGLLPAITIVLAIGMRRIAKHKGLVRRLAATETLGGVTVICTDKTGTLTQGKMLVDRILTEEEDHNMPLRVALLVSDAFIENPDAPLKDMIIRGRSTEQAFLRAGISQGLRKDVLDREYKILDTVFFSSEHKYSANLRQGMLDEKTLYVIGAPERILEKVIKVTVSGEEKSIDSGEYRNLTNQMDEFTSRGFRVVACAYRSIDQEIEKGKLRDEVKDLTLSGFIVISDPLRSDVKMAFEKTRRAGIRTVIITGDHKVTARVIAEQVGFSIGPQDILEGHELENMSDEVLKEKIKTVALYARVSPRHKLRIVKAFQEQGEIVAMFGDGVNDAPALKIANIGVAVSSEVDAVREVADIVLLDGGFSTIVKAIEQGRVIFDNIRRVFLYLITQDFSQFFIFLISIAFGLPLPLIAAQLLLVNLVESGLPDLALTTEEEKDGIMDEAPRNPKESILNKTAFHWMLSMFAISGGIAMIFYYALFKTIDDIDKVRTMVMVFLCFEALFLSFSVRSFRKSIFRKDILNNKWLTAAVSISFLMVVAVIYIEPLQKILSTVPLSGFEWGIIFATNVVEIIFIDKFKTYFFRFKSSKNQAHTIASAHPVQ